MQGYLAGVDEAGRGAIAGPVFAGACILKPCRKIPAFIRDSKQCSPKEREEAFAWIQDHTFFGFGYAEADMIDREGILAATERAMQSAVAMLCRTARPTTLLVDGRDHFWFDFPHISMIGGDALEPAISAASIIAKVLRDRRMCEEHARFPNYGFSEHKGYGTPGHFAMLRKYGMNVLHRKTFLGIMENEKYTT